MASGNGFFCSEFRKPSHKNRHISIDQFLKEDLILTNEN